MKISDCTRCKHKFDDMKCNAFPFGIPWSVYLGEIFHDYLLEGQTGLFVYEPKNIYKGFSIAAKRKHTKQLLSQIDDVKKEILNRFFSKVRQNNHNGRIWKKAIFFIKWIDERTLEYPPIKVYYKNEVVLLDELYFRSFMRRKASYLKQDEDCSYREIKLTIFPDGSHQFEFEKAEGTSKAERMEKYRMELKEINDRAEKKGNI